MFSKKSIFKYLCHDFCKFLNYKYFHCLNQILDLEFQYRQYHENEVEVMVYGPYDHFGSKNM